ncbi:rhodanese-like domain-containing protein [Candidatus Villigracilis saccharophilus]|uniref:rhodanese-like domain-containing protein n=1 Tax=Candidatus Villigracilis saccharophilus TaxID=3140684 RepID=UPI00313552FD|nr:rhodanese-like domain-containing protein [Anaerolineales bacterium]
MKNGKIKLFLIASVLFSLTLACNAAVPQTGSDPLPTIQGIATQPKTEGQNIPLTEADVPRISVEDAKAAVDNAGAVIVDVRSAESFAAGHVAGAISIPLINFENNPADIPLEKDQWIITYCT